MSSQVEVFRPLESVEAVSLSLHGQRIGVLSHYAGGKNILVFDPEYNALPSSIKPTFTLTQTLGETYLTKPLIHAQKLPPVLSNLLPEGSFRDWMAASLKVHKEDEFPLLAWSGRNLPGALLVEPIAKGEIPAWALAARERSEPVQIEVNRSAQKFSLAGVQMKFSSSHQEGRFNLNSEAGGDSWIIKTPSTLHKDVPKNEYSAMKLAEAIGVNIPDIKLVDLTDLENLPDIQLPNESLAYAIKRFDRKEKDTGFERVHTEDFAQVFELYPQDKYSKRNYEQIAAAIYQQGAQGLEDIQQMARRLLANILLANGDAHLKNWSLIYPDAREARLSPAYDIVTTLAFIKNERSLALNMAKQKDWYEMSLHSFQAWAERIEVPWPAIRVHLLDALDKAQTRWPDLLKDLPMTATHRSVLQAHWKKLSKDLNPIKK